MLALLKEKQNKYEFQIYQIYLVLIFVIFNIMTVKKITGGKANANKEKLSLARTTLG